MDYDKEAAGFGLLADPNRLRILALLRQKAEQNGGELLEALPISQPTLSHHMKLLCQGGLVEGRRCGQRTLYRLNLTELDRLLELPLGEARPAAPAPSHAPVIVRSGHKW